MGPDLMRRRVFYIPGYDPIPPRRYRELYRREGRRQAQVSGYHLAMTRSRHQGFGWGVDGRFGADHTHAAFEVLVWSDLVRGSMGASIAATYGQLLRTAWAYIGSGALMRLMRLRLAPVLAALYPVVMLLVQLALALATGAATGWLALALLPAPLALGAGLGAVVAALMGFRRLDSRFFAYYLMHDYAFTARDGGAYPPALRDRLDQFADRIAAALAEDWDEVLVIGHSSGAYLGVSVLAGLLRTGRLPGDARLSFLSLGHVVPMAAFLPRATALRADLEVMATQDRVFWVDVTAPGDACCFGLCDPVAVCRDAPAPQSQPLVLSAAFSQTLSPAQQKSLSGRWFRKHFQYLCAFDRPGDYDYFAITAGPLSLRQRFGHRGHSPGRIARPVNRFAKAPP